MSDDRYINITFPFEEDTKGKWLKLNNNSKDATKSKLANLITTKKGERLYKPDYGTNIMDYIFEPLDDFTYNEIRQEILSTVSKYLSEVEIQNVEANIDYNNYFIGLKISYTESDGVFKEKNNLNLLF